jgi:hypothetical protein
MQSSQSATGGLTSALDSSMTRRLLPILCGSMACLPIWRGRRRFCTTLSFLGQPYTEADDFVLAEWSLERVTTFVQKIHRRSKGSTLGSVQEGVTFD